MEAGSGYTEWEYEFMIYKCEGCNRLFKNERMLIAHQSVCSRITNDKPIDEFLFEGIQAQHDIKELELEALCKYPLTLHSEIREHLQKLLS